MGWCIFKTIRIPGPRGEPTLSRGTAYPRATHDPKYGVVYLPRPIAFGRRRPWPKKPLAEDNFGRRGLQPKASLAESAWPEATGRRRLAEEASGRRGLWPKRCLPKEPWPKRPLSNQAPNTWQLVPGGYKTHPHNHMATQLHSHRATYPHSHIAT